VVIWPAPDELLPAPDGVPAADGFLLTPRDLLPVAAGLLSAPDEVLPAPYGVPGLMDSC
jgi:hypothetical protein